MRTISTLLFVGLVTTSAWGQTTYTWTGATDATWATVANWTPSRVTPATSDILVFDGTQTNQPVISADETVGRISVTGNTTLTISNGTSTMTLTTSGGSPKPFQVASGVTFTVDASGASGNGQVSVGTGGGSVVGTITITGLAQLLCTDATNKLKFESGSAFNASQTSGGPFGGSTGTTTDGVEFLSGSTFNHNSGANPFQKSQPNSIVAFDPGSQYNFNFTSNATIGMAGRVYPNVTFGGTSGTTYRHPTSGSANCVINGDMVLNATISLSGDGWSGQSQISGNITNNGTWTSPTAGSVMLNGTSAQTMSGSGTTTIQGGGLTVSNSAGITLGQSVSVASLTFTAGKISTGANTLTVTSGSVTGAGSSSFVDGNLAYNVGSTSTYAFPTGQGSDYLPLTMSFTSLSGSDAVMASAISRSTTPPAGSLGSNKVLDRYFHVTNGSGITAFSADMTLSYSDADLTAQGITDENSLRVFKGDGMTWSEVAVTTRDIGANTIDISGVSSFSDFVISGTGDTPLPVVMRGISAKVNGRNVVLSFSTAMELNIAGFDILRSNTQTEPSEVLSSYTTNAALKTRGGATSCTSYSFTDTHVSAGHTYYYRVRAVEKSGAMAVVSGVVEVSLRIPKELDLYQNYPNPFNPVTIVRFDLKEPSDVTIQVFNLLGVMMKSLSFYRDEGSFETRVDMSNMPSGVYYYRMIVIGKSGGNFVSTKKMMLIR